MPITIQQSSGLLQTLSIAQDCQFVNQIQNDDINNLADKDIGIFLMLIYPIICCLQWGLVAREYLRSGEGDHKRYLPPWSYLGISNIIAELKGEDQSSCNQSMLENRITHSFFQVIPLMIYNMLLTQFTYSNAGLPLQVMIHNCLCFIHLLQGIMYTLQLMSTFDDWGSTCSIIAALTVTLMKMASVVMNFIVQQHVWGWWGILLVIGQGAIGVGVIVLMSAIEQSVCFNVFNRDRDGQQGFK